MDNFSVYLVSCVVVQFNFILLIHIVPLTVDIVSKCFTEPKA